MAANIVASVVGLVAAIALVVKHWRQPEERFVWSLFGTAFANLLWYALSPGYTAQVGLVMLATAMLAALLTSPGGGTPPE